MNEFLASMALPLLACLILAGIHAYLGFHVIERQVIFVDLALAQIAALGLGVALLGGYEPDSVVSYGLSLVFTFVGAVIFSLTRLKKIRVPQEAMIGIVYVVAAALLMALLSRSGEGDEHIRHVLAGDLLLVRSSEVVAMAVLYAVIGAFHYMFRERFLLISRDPEEAIRRGWNLIFWDFLFYSSFGIVLTGSVKIAGVLPVFAFLVVPAVCAVLWSDRLKVRLIVGWVVGFLGSLLGMAASWWFDIPTGASIVCAFGVIVAVVLILRTQP